MRDDLTVSTGGLTSVDTDAMDEVSARLSALDAELSDLAQRADRAAWNTGVSALTEPFGAAERSLRRAATTLSACAEHSRQLALATGAAANAYRAAEERNSEAARLGTSLLAVNLGAAVRQAALMAIFNLPVVIPAVISTALLLRIPEVRRAAALLGDGVVASLAAHEGALRSPAVVELIRLVVSSADDAMLGASGVPAPISSLLGDTSVGLAGLEFAARAAMTLGGSRALTETAVSVRPSERFPAWPPTTLTEAASRIPPAAAGAPQVRVERYTTADGDDHYAVYVAGTSDFAVEPGDEPFDMTSNVAAVAAADAAGVRAVETALADAGATSDDAVSLFGHSQGGLIAARIAESGDFNVESLVTFGAPTAHIDVPPHVTQLAVEHADDLVPALGGIPFGGERGDDRVVVSRHAFPGGADGPGLVPAHAMTSYATTAELIDRSDDPRLSSLIASVGVIGLGAAAGRGAVVAGRGATYRAERKR